MWGVIAASRVRGPLFPQATGGIEDFIIIEGEVYKRHRFLNSDTFNVIQKGDFDFILVAGGGAGGTSTNSVRGAGGGGAGGCIVSSENLLVGTYPVTIGDGGLPNSVSPWTGNNGQDSTFYTFTAIGGGGGGRGENGPNNGLNGGSGGGGGAELGAGGLGTVGQGNDGGTHSGVSLRRGGSGGGGASQIGGAGGSVSAGSGGEGVYSKILQTRLAGGGGGGAGTNSITLIGYGRDGGGDGSDSVAKASSAGQPNTGGGGGAGYSLDVVRKNGSAGGSGILSIAYKTGLPFINPISIRQTKIFNVTIASLASTNLFFDNPVLNTSKVVITVGCDQVRNSTVSNTSLLIPSTGASFPGGTWEGNTSNSYDLTNTNTSSPGLFRVVMVEFENVQLIQGIGNEVVTSSTSIDSTITDVDKEEMIVVLTKNGASDILTPSNSFTEELQVGQLGLFVRRYSTNELGQFTTLSRTGSNNTIRQYTIKLLPKYTP